MKALLFATPRRARPTHKTWATMREAELRVILKRRCREFERCNSLRNHAESEAIREDIKRLNELIDGRRPNTREDEQTGRGGQARADSGDC